jgi:hemoglobin
MYERLGGMAFFEALTERFYAGVAGDEVLRPLYPPDLEAPRRHLCLFLAQFFGGPRAYSEQRGEPRLKARHERFRIGAAERDRWMYHMWAAVEASGAGPLERAQMLSYFAGVAGHLVNSHESGPPPLSSGGPRS